jgi:amino acid adenylation domain-containing protein
MSYKKLDSLTDKVAATLVSRGVKRGDRVGIYVPKSLASVVGIYSILKAGGTYVPLDPDAPPERLAFIARDCDIRTLVSCSSKAEGANSILGKGCPVATLVEVDCDEGGYPPKKAVRLAVPDLVSWEEVLSSEGDAGVTNSAETDTAYILYTSGSTGVPKGVMISHRGSLSFVDWGAKEVQLDQNDIVACHAPLHFDISTFSIFSTCRAGASVVMIPEGASVFPTQLAKMIEQERMTVWYSVPSVLTLLVLYGNLPAYDLSRLRAVVFAGEVFPVKYLKQLMSTIPRARYLNWYGPTETNVCTSYELSPLDPDRYETIPIGKACANDEVFALDSAGKVVTKPGQKGQLYVRGPTLMQGYWGDLEKTSRVLVGNPQDLNSGERVCKTGDIVALDEEGNYLYLGREDGMIKTRGYRVELGEIEAVIYAHPEVKEVVAIPVPDELIGNRIHVFVSPHRAGALTKDDLLTYCGSKLPRYMIPDGVEFLETLPKTSSGKADRVGLATLISNRGAKQ